MAPVVLFLAAFFLWPVMQMIALSVSAKTVNGVTVHGLTFDNYIRLVSSDLYFRILLRTLRLALMASFVSILFAYPLAIAVARGGPTMARIVTMSVVAPLLVNVVVRAYGWQAILNKAGALAYVLKLVGVAQPPSLLYTEWAVLIACVHVYLPFMVMPLATAISRIKPSTEEAARIAGLRRPWCFCVSHFRSACRASPSASPSFSRRPRRLRHAPDSRRQFSPLLGTLIEQQMLTLNDWPFAAAISTLLIAIVLTANIVFSAHRQSSVRALDRKSGGRMMKVAPILMRVLIGVIIALVLAPLVVPFLMSVSDTPFIVFPLRGFTLHWYGEVLANVDARTAFFFSLKLAFTVTMVSLLLGVPCALGLTRYPVPGRDAVLGLVLSPLIVPLLVTGVALLQIFAMFGSRATFMQLVIGHTVVCRP